MGPVHILANDTSKPTVSIIRERNLSSGFVKSLVAEQSADLPVTPASLCHFPRPFLSPPDVDVADLHDRRAEECGGAAARAGVGGVAVGGLGGGCAACETYL